MPNTKGNYDEAQRPSIILRRSVRDACDSVRAGEGFLTPGGKPTKPRRVNTLNQSATVSQTSVKRRLLTEKEAAEYIGVSVSFLRKSRCYGTLPGHTPGPRFFKIGRMVRYDVKDLDDWIEEYKHEVR